MAQTYHIEGNHIAERDIASLVPLDQILVYQDRAAASGQAQDERPLRRGLEGVDAFWNLAISRRVCACKDAVCAPMM
jgi:hypothetical protein